MNKKTIAKLNIGPVNGFRDLKNPGVYYEVLDDGYYCMRYNLPQVDGRMLFSLRRLIGEPIQFGYSPKLKSTKSVGNNIDYLRFGIGGFVEAASGIFKETSDLSYWTGGNYRNQLHTICSSNRLPIHPRLVPLHSNSPYARKSILMRKTGDLICSTSSGSILYTGHFVKGAQHGRCTSQYPNGGLATVESWDRGTPSGPWEFYAMSGRLLCRMTYERGCNTRSLRSGAPTSEAGALWPPAFTMAFNSCKKRR